MRILIIDTYYSPFLSDFYQRDIVRKKLNYDDQTNLIFDQLFGTANFYSVNLKKLGIEAKEIIYNNKILQFTWALENNLTLKKNNFKNENKNLELILQAQIEDFKPDILYCQNLSSPSQVFLKKIRKKQKNIRLIIGQVASPIEFKKPSLKQFNLILTSFPHFVDRFKKIKINATYFKIGFEKSILSKLTKQPIAHDLTFVGGFTKYHSQGNELLEYLALNSKIKIWGYGLEKLKSDSPIKKCYQGEAWGKEMYNILFNSKITINRHIDVAENFANNMRLYEATGCGALLLTDDKDNLNELFKVGIEIDNYHSPQELLEKINYYLTHEEERAKIAKAGQERTLKEHSYEERMKELKNIITKII